VRRPTSKALKVNQSTQAKMRLGFVCALLALFGIGSISENRLQRWIDDAAWVSETQQALAELVSVSAALRAVESEQRGYLLTGDPEAKKSFEAARKQTVERFAALQALTRANPVARQRLDRVAPLLTQVLTAASLAIEQRAQTKVPVPYTLTTLGTEPAMTDIRILFRDFFGEEWRLLGERSESSHRSTVIVNAAIIIGTLFGGLCVAVCGILVNRDLRRREEAEAALRRAQQDLEDRVKARTSELQCEILEHRQTEKELQIEIGERKRATEQAEAASRAKSQFLANMSHEIRTPINGILGMTDIVLSTDLTGDQRECLDIVKTSADSLLSVVNDILDVSKIEAGKLELDPIPFDLIGEVEGAIRMLAFAAQEKGLEMICEIAPDVPRHVVADPARLRQVIVNLVGNAIKFTAQGQVRVAVTLEREHAQQSWLRFAVRDTGIGIPSEKQALIFEPFSQADGSMTRKFGGTGLGLTISSSFVAAMEGTIWVESKVGKGSCFYFQIPCKSVPTTSMTPSADISFDSPTLVTADSSRF
jgi:two-component system sensor histidine kinase/response regulator